MAWPQKKFCCKLKNILAISGSLITYFRGLSRPPSPSFYLIDNWFLFRDPEGLCCFLISEDAALGAQRIRYFTATQICKHEPLTGRNNSENEKFSDHQIKKINRLIADLWATVRYRLEFPSLEIFTHQTNRTATVWKGPDLILTKFIQQQQLKCPLHEFFLLEFLSLSKFCQILLVSSLSVF